MSLADQPRLRRVERFPIKQPSGELSFALRDPEGFAGSVVLPYAAAVLASLMDGSPLAGRNPADLRAAVRAAGRSGRYRWQLVANSTNGCYSTPTGFARVGSAKSRSI